MQENDKNWRIKLYSFSPWILGSACMVLLFVLAIFAITNYEREKTLITAALEQKGLTLLRFVSSTVRDSMRSSMGRTQPYGRWEDYMQPALDLAAEQPGVEYIYIVDRHGKTLLTAGEGGIGDKEVHEEVRLLLEGLYTAGPRVWRRVIFSTADGQEKAIIATRFSFAGEQPKWRRKPRGGMSNGHWRSRQQSAFIKDMERIEDWAPVYVVQLDFSEFSAPLKRQFLQIVLELVAIFLVGLGGTLSFLTLRRWKGSEAQLDKVKGFNDILVSSLPIGVIATGGAGYLKMMNNAAKSMSGVTSTALGKQPTECLPAVIADKFGACIERSATDLNGASRVDECVHGPRTLEITLFPITVNTSDSVGEVMLLRDVTDIKRLENELQRNERLAVVGKMAAGVAHELRNPLSSIKGLALLMQSKIDATEDSENFAKTFVAEVERLNRSISELLDYARPSKLNFEPVSLADIVSETLVLLGPDFTNNKVEVTTQIEDNLPLSELDRDKIRDVILNLLLNSLQAMESVSRPSHLNIALVSDESVVILKVRDNGTGIAPEHLKRVFDPYYTSKSNGTGLGLALSQKSVDEHDGKLHVESVHGQWTEFQLRLGRI